MKGISTILSGVIYFALALTVVTLVVTIATPQFERLQESTMFYQARDSFANLDKAITKVASEGRGSVRIIPIQLREGEVKIEGANDAITFGMESKAEIVSPRTAIAFGNLVIGSNIDVNATENSTNYIIENGHLQVVLLKNGTTSQTAYINASTFIKWIKQKDTGQILPLNAGDPVVEFIISDNPKASAGYGYTSIGQTGSYLEKGNATAHITTDYGNYDIHVTLESEADHLIISVSKYG